MTREDVRAWIENPEAWPTADSYAVDSLEPCPTLQRRESMLRGMLPRWFWEGEEGASILSIGTGKGYFERKFWGRFDKIYVVDPSEQTRLSLTHLPIPNAEFLGRSLFTTSWRTRLDPVPQYGWLGACIHYLFREFRSWEFMKKLAMLVSDTLVIDAGVFDSTGSQGKYLLDSWRAQGGDEPFERHQSSQFSYQCFGTAIEGLWHMLDHCTTPWINDGRRNVLLKRVLPPSIQRSELGAMERIIHYPGRPSPVYRTELGYYREAAHMGPLLIYDTVSKVMGWDDMVRWVVYDGDRFIGFVVRDYGEQLPDRFEPSVTEWLYLGLSSWLLPLGLLPIDLARENIRVLPELSVWIDIDLIGLQNLDPCTALWSVTNMYRQYARRPHYVRSAVLQG